MAEDTQREIMGIINRIVEKSSDGNCLYRGEPECYTEVSASLWRLLKENLNKDKGLNMIKPDIRGPEKR